MTKLRDDPIRAVPKRVLLLSLVLTVILVGIAYLMGWPMMELLIGFWIGVVVSLISFRLMVMSAKKLLEKNKGGLSAQLGFGFFGRFGLYIICFFATAQISLYALLASAIGLSMVGLALKLEGFFPAATTANKKE